LHCIISIDNNPSEISDIDIYFNLKRDKAEKEKVLNDILSKKMKNDKIMYDNYLKILIDDSKVFGPADYGEEEK
jgi:hypothetical protein